MSCKLKRTVLLLFLSWGVSTYVGAQIYEGITAFQADSLINANVDNPNFVILDVRTPGEYNPQHLEGAINRNFYDSDFDSQLDALDKEKMYLIHCKSGGRSGVTLGKMETLNFAQVYDMLGGMNAWNAQSYPTTAEFAPRLMFVTEDQFPLKEVPIGAVDTIEVTVTNRANSVLAFTAFSDLAGTEFDTDFDMGTTLEGAADYTFHIFYTPTDEEADVLDFSVGSNGGDLVAHIERKGFFVLRTGDDDISSSIRLVPNPARESIQLQGLQAGEVDVRIVSLSGQPVYEQPNVKSEETIDISALRKGVYFVNVVTQKGSGSVILIVK